MKSQSREKIEGYKIEQLFDLAQGEEFGNTHAREHFEQALKTLIDEAKAQERTSLLGEIEKLKKEYKNNDDYRDYGTLHENVCHDDGYMAALADVLSSLEDVGGGNG